MSGSSNRPADSLTPAVLHILLALAGGARHGYAIMRSVDAAGGPRMGPGTVYGSLQRMQDSGLVREASGEPSARPRRYYDLTEAGERALREEAGRLVKIADLLRTRGIASADQR